MHPKIEDFVENTQKGINEDMKNRGRTIKALFTFDLPEDPEEIVKVAMMPLLDEFDGEMISMFVNGFRPKFDVVVMVCETWKGSNPDLAPSEDPERTEAMIIVVYNKEKTHFFLSDMTRISDEQVIMGEWQEVESENTGGRLMQPYRNDPNLN